MPNINDKGVSVPTWLSSVIMVGLLTVAGYVYSGQAEINKQVVDTLVAMRQDIVLGMKDYSYLVRRVEDLESENKELHKQNDQQQREIDELKRYHRP